METFGTMRKKEVEMNNKGHLLIIQALCKGGYVEEAFSMISLLGETPDHYPDLHMYNNLLGACADMKHTDYAKKCLDLMDHAFMGKDERTYMELLKLAVLQQNLSAVHCIWEECTKYYSLNIISLRKFIRSFTRLGDLKSAFGALQQMVALVGRGGFNISKTGQGKLRDSRLDIPIPFKGDMNWSDYGIKDETSVPSVYENYENAESQAGSTELYTTSNAKMKEVNSAGLHGPSKPVMKLLRWSFSDLIHACAKAKDCELAERLFLQMQNLGVDPSCGTYDGFIRALVGARGFRDGIQALKLMQQKNMKPHDSTFATLSIGCSKALKLDLAEAFINQIPNSSVLIIIILFLKHVPSWINPNVLFKFSVK